MKPFSLFLLYVSQLSSYLRIFAAEQLTVAYSSSRGSRCRVGHAGFSWIDVRVPVTGIECTRKAKRLDFRRSLRFSQRPTIWTFTITRVGMESNLYYNNKFINIGFSLQLPF